MDRDGLVGGREKELADGYVAWLGRTIVVAVVVLAALRGWYGFALVAICAAAGPSLGGALLRVVSNRKAAVAALGVTAVVCVGLAVAGFGGLLSFAQYRGVGLWQPLLALLVPFLSASAFRLWAEREHLREAQKLRMMLDLYPHPDGGRWSGERIEEATGGDLSRETFDDLREGSGRVFGILGLDLDGAAALARAVDFPLELWYRRLGWWEAVHRDWRRGADVSERLQEWDCVTPERAAERLKTSAEEVLRMVRFGELEGRQDREGNWQIREHGVFEKELEARGKDPSILPPHPRNARPGRTGSGNYHDRYGKPL